MIRFTCFKIIEDAITLCAFQKVAHNYGCLSEWLCLCVCVSVCLRETENIRCSSEYSQMHTSSFMETAFMEGWGFSPMRTILGVYGWSFSSRTPTLAKTHKKGRKYRNYVRLQQQSTQYCVQGLNCSKWPLYKKNHGYPHEVTCRKPRSIFFSIRATYFKEHMSVTIYMCQNRKN